MLLAQPPASLIAAMAAEAQCEACGHDRERRGVASEGWHNLADSASVSWSDQAISTAHWHDNDALVI